jgi:hypothetical protein
VLRVVSGDPEAYMNVTPSSVIERIYYSARRHELFVSFTSGRVYVYFGVSETEYRAFENADSLGRYFNSHIRDHYDYRELKIA